MNIFNYIFHSHKWKLLSSNKYFIILKDSETLIGLTIGEHHITKYTCEICKTEYRINHDKIMYETPKKIETNEN